MLKSVEIEKIYFLAEGKVSSSGGKKGFSCIRGKPQLLEKVTCKIRYIKSRKYFPVLKFQKIFT